MPRATRRRFVGQAGHRAPDEPDGADAIESAIGAIPDTGHEWDDDPAAWVRSQRDWPVGR